MIQALGWLGSALIVASLAMRRPLPFRFINLISALVLLGFNIAIALWSMVALNVAILAVNAWYLRRLLGNTGGRSEQGHDRLPAPTSPAASSLAQSDRFARALGRRRSDVTTVGINSIRER